MSSQPAPKPSLPGIGQTDPNAKVSAEHASGLSALQRKRAELAAKLKADEADKKKEDAIRTGDAVGKEAEIAYAIRTGDAVGKEAEIAYAAKEEEEAAKINTIETGASEISLNNATITNNDTLISSINTDLFKKDSDGKFVATAQQVTMSQLQIQNLKEENAELNAKNEKIAADLKAASDADKSGFSYADALKGIGTGLNLAVAGVGLGSLLKGQPDVPTPPSAGETLGELGAVAAGTEYGINQQLANYGPGLAVDALQDADLAAAWDAAGRPDFNTWAQSVLQDPTSPTARKLAEMLDPYNVEAKERGRRIDEAANFYNEYDASQFQSPEMQAAQSYASGLTSDPLSMQNRQYMEQELAGDYSQGWYDDLRSDLFSSMHPGAVGNSMDVAKAVIGSEAAMRGRRNEASDRIARDDALRMSYAPSYASIAASGSADPLSLSNVGKMGIGNIEPMDPTGAFFGSFPAMEYDTNLAAYQREPTQMQKVTALPAVH